MNITSKTWAFTTSLLCFLVHIMRSEIWDFQSFCYSDNIKPECLIDIVWIVTNISYTFLCSIVLGTESASLTNNWHGGLITCNNTSVSIHWQRSVSRRLVNDRKVSEGSHHNSLHLTSTPHIHTLLTAWCLLGNWNSKGDLISSRCLFRIWFGYKKYHCMSFFILDAGCLDLLELLVYTSSLLILSDYRSVTYLFSWKVSEHKPQKHFAGGDHRWP